MLITSDQQRFDTLGVNGNPLVRTPHLDALARKGVNFQRAYVTNPVCVASRACIQTGRYTHQHGVEYMENVVDATPGLPPWEVTFMERLQMAGYRTAAFGKIHMYPAKGFDEMRLSGGQGARWDRPFGSPLGPSPLGYEYAQWLEERNPGGFSAIHEQRRTDEYKRHGGAVTSPIAFDEYVDSWVATNTVDFLQRQQDDDQPFFVWCGFLNPHGPLDAPAPYDTLYDPAQVPIPDTFLADVSDRPTFYADRQQAFRNDPDTGKLRRMLAHYYGLCTMLDDLCGRLVETLHDSGLWQNTLIIFTSDHGDMLGDFGMTGKSNFMEPTIRVPLIVKPPDDTKTSATELDDSASQQASSRLVEVPDIAATILDYAHVPRPSSMQAKSLRPLIENGQWDKEQILCEFTSNDRQFKGKCLRTERYKYIIWTYCHPEKLTAAPQEELYDMEQDPQERRSVVDSAKHGEILSEMRTRLLAHLTLSEKPLMNYL